MASSRHGSQDALAARGERPFLVVTRGDARLDNRKVKATFGGKASMLDAAEVEALTGHPVGGVCPFGLATDLPVYCDVSIKTLDEVVPAAGSINSAVRSTRCGSPNSREPNGWKSAGTSLEDEASQSPSSLD